MEYKDICLKVIEKEMKNFEPEFIKHSTFEFESTALFTENFDIPYNRCVYLSRYAYSCLYIFNDSIAEFLLDCRDAKDIVSEWNSHAEVKVCSLTTGPGLDYFAFMLAIVKFCPFPPNFTGAKVISRYGAWQDTANFILEVLYEQGSVCGFPWSKFNYNIEVVQMDDLMKCFSEDMNVKKECALLSNAHIVLMMRTLNLYAFGLQQETSTLQMLKELVSSLRSDATIFCVDTLPSLALFKQALSCFPGKFLYGPIIQTYKIPVHIFEGTKCSPEAHFNGAFFVWRKLSYDFSKFMSPGTILLNTKSKKKKPYLIYSNCFTAEKPKQKIKTSEILPWRELPLCKIPWGKLFWQNASITTKKSLKSVLCLKKDSRESHWIGDVANLYVKEFGTSQFSILSEETEKVPRETFDESSKESAQMVTEILEVPIDLVTPHSAHILKEEICDSTNTKSLILEEHSLDNSSSSSSTDFLKGNSEFKPIKSGLTIPENSFVEDSKKAEIMTGALKQIAFDADVINNTSLTEMTPLNTDHGSESENTSCKTDGNSKTCFFKLDFVTDEKCNGNQKPCKILPWKKLPPGKIPWGKIFWQNASSIMKKSLKSVLSLEKEGIEGHWIGEVYNLYLKEFSNLNVSKLSESTDIKITSKCSLENNSQSKNMITEMLSILNEPSYLNAHNLKNLNYNDTNTKNTLIEENIVIDTQSFSTLDIHNGTSNFNCKPVKCDLTTKSADAFVHDLNKREIKLPVKLEERIQPNPIQTKIKKPLINTVETIVNTTQNIQPNKNEETEQLPFETETSPTNIPEIIQEKIDLSIEALTESIKHLMTSVERIIHQNRTNFHQSCNTCHHQIHGTSESNMCRHHITCASHSPYNSFTASRQNSSLSNNNFQNNDFALCSSFHCKCQCCHCKHNMKSMHSCHSQAYSKISCCASNMQLACSGNQPSIKSPRIVIPIENISDDALLELVSILKSEFKSG